MRRIVTAISSAALALSLVASAVPANAAVAGYDSAYAGESAFLTLSQGSTGTFQVFFLNTGATAWTRNTSTQVDLAACLEDKTTCDAQDATEAPFNSGWLTLTRYATTVQTSVAPGAIGNFTYNVTVPAAQAAGTYRFNGALVLNSTGADIHNEGYYQELTVPTPTAATITSISPTSGTIDGGTSVTITGTGFVCTTFPTVNFGANAATVSSCGSTSLVATSPAGAAGAVDVTVTNTGAAASNAETYTYVDTTTPAAATITSISPTSGTTAGGTSVTITGTGFDCTTSPTVNFGANAATVDSCESTSLVATSPAGAEGAVDVTVTNTGAAASNAATYTYTTPATAATITSISPTTGTTAGGTTVTITGTGFVCNPTFPTVNFGTNAATVTSCGATTLTVTSPAGAAGAANVTVTNSGAAASNIATYTYVAPSDTTKPTYTSLAVAGNIATLTFSEPVCNPTATNSAGTDFTVTVTGGVATTASSEGAPTCNSATAPTNGVTSFNVFLSATPTTGSLVTITLNATSGSVNANYVDAAANTANAPRTNNATSTTAETTKPTLVSASGTGGSAIITLTFSEPVFCSDPQEAGDITVAGPTTIQSTTTNTCPTSQEAAATSYTVTMASALASSTQYTVTLNSTLVSGETRDVAGNDIAVPTSATFTTTLQDTTPPTLSDARIVTNAGITTNMDSGDVFTVTFSEAMNTNTTGDEIRVQDTDNSPAAGDTGTVICGTNATCSFATGGLVLTVTITGQVATDATKPVGYPATITSLLGFSDAAGNQPNLTGSADRIIDYE